MKKCSPTAEKLQKRTDERDGTNNEGPKVVSFNLASGTVNDPVGRDERSALHLDAKPA